MAGNALPNPILNNTYRACVYGSIYFAFRMNLVAVGHLSSSSSSFFLSGLTGIEVE